MQDLEAALRGAVDRLPLAIFSHDGECLTAANATLARILGRPGAPPVGVDLKFLVHPDDRARLADDIRALDAGRDSLALELRLLAADNEPRQFRGHMVATDSGGYLVVAGEVLAEPPPGAPASADHPDVAEARATLDVLAAGDANELAELLALVVESTTKVSEKLVAAALADDRKQVRFHGHTLKGTLRTSGMESLAALVEHVELGAAQLDAQELRTRTAEIQARVVALVRALAP